MSAKLKIKKKLKLIDITIQKLILKTNLLELNITFIKIYALNNLNFGNVVN